MNLKLLTVISTPELLNAVADTIRRYTDIWTCMDAHETLINALCAARETWNWSSRQAQSRPLLCLLIEYLEHPALTLEAKNQINEDATALMHVSTLNHFDSVSSSLHRKLGPCSTQCSWSTRTRDAGTNIHALARGRYRSCH